MFNIFPAEGDERRIFEEDQYPAADSPAFFTIHNPLAGLELEFSTHSPASPALAIEDLRTSQGEVQDKRVTPRAKDVVEGRGREGSGGPRWDGADSKEMLARELGLLLQANPHLLRSMSAEVAGAAAGSGTQNTLSTQGHALLDELMSSLTTGGVGEYTGDLLVRPLSGHFTRVTQLEEQVKDLQIALELERSVARRAAEDTQAIAQVAQAQEDSRRALELCNQRNDKEMGEIVRKLVHTLDSIVVNTTAGSKGIPLQNSRDKDKERTLLEDTIEGLKEENATLDRLYRQTKAELEALQQEVKEGGGGGHDSLRKKNQQLAKELELLHKDYESLLQSKGMNNDGEGTDDSDEFYEDKRGRKKNKGGGFLKRIIG